MSKHQYAICYKKILTAFNTCNVPALLHWSCNFLFTFLLWHFNITVTSTSMPIFPVRLLLCKAKRSDHRPIHSEGANSAETKSFKVSQEIINNYWNNARLTYEAGDRLFRILCVSIYSAFKCFNQYKYTFHKAFIQHGFIS
jgi:hypothetical protein